MRKPLSGLAAGLLAAACALYSEVVIGPLLLDPDHTRRRSSDPRELVEMGEFTQAIQSLGDVETRSRISARDLATLGSAELAAGRFDDARRHLRRALDLKPIRTEIARIAWDLSQVEYLASNYDAAHEWALMADRHGMQIRSWHLDYLEALANVNTYRVEGARSATSSIVATNPNIPRLEVHLEGKRPQVAVIDSGAVLSIISATLAQELAIQPLGDFRGSFYGLLGEPISVSFGLIRTIQIGEMVVHDTPVAIMPDQKLNFVVMNREPFEMDLLLGANFLKQFRIELDFAKDEVTFDALGAGAPYPAENQNLFFVGFRPFVHGAINRRAWYLFVLDTGSEITFLNEEQFDATFLRAFPKLHGATLQGLGGSRKMGAKVEDIEIGVDRWAGEFKDIPLYSTEYSRALGIIGEDFLQNFRVVIDFGTMRVDLHRQRTFRGRS